MLPAHKQADYRVRFDWGLSGARAVVGGCDIAVVVDVLSFTMTLTVAADRGITVLPYPWREDAATFAAEHDAELAVGRRQRKPGQVSLSPTTIRESSGLERLVLPSPNGSTIAFTLADAGVRVIGASLRNAGAVAEVLAGTDGVVAVIAAGSGGRTTRCAPPSKTCGARARSSKVSMRRCCHRKLRLRGRLFKASTMLRPNCVAVQAFAS